MVGLTVDAVRQGLLPLAAGLQAVIDRYDAYGPLAAAFLANLLATFGDKGQLVIFTLASRYDAKKVFVGAMAAFSLWSAVEVAFGQWVMAILPDAVITAVTGGLFIVFGLWTLYVAVGHFRAARGREDDALMTGGGIDIGISGRVLPDEVVDQVGRHGGVLTSFVFILFAEFGDKTQLLTINLAATFPDAPLAVFVGVVAALGLRTGIDAAIGERFERWVPTRWVEVVAAGIFLTFGVLVVGWAPTLAPVALGAVAVLGVWGTVRRVR